MNYEDVGRMVEQITSRGFTLQTWQCWDKKKWAARIERTEDDDRSFAPFLAINEDHELAITECADHTVEYVARKEAAREALRKMIENPYDEATNEL